MKFFLKFFLLTCICFFSATNVQATPKWTFHGKVAEGGQFDVLTGPDGKVHLISRAYYQFDAIGRKLVIENVGDDKQGEMNFPPALALDTQGNVHILTRHGGSSASSGFDIRYRRRAAAGGWTEDFLVGSRETRNYVVGIAATSIDSVYMHYTKAFDNVWGDVKLWEKNGFLAVHMGDLGGIWRADTDARMRGFNGKLFLVSGKCDGSGAAYFTFCNDGAGCFDELSSHIQVHASGNYRKGMPDLYVDKTGSVHMTYGAQFEVYYNRYAENQQLVFGQDKKIFSGLGSWHLQLGLSAIAASENGSVVVAVALDPDGSKEARNSELLWTYSRDGGESWSEPESLDVYTDGGEGRRRPRLVVTADKALLFFRENGTGGISLASIALDAISGPSSPLHLAPVNHLLLN